MKKLLLLTFALAARPLWAQNVVSAPAETAQWNLTLLPGNAPALVSDRRAVNLNAGRNIVRFPGVPSLIVADTIQPLFSGTRPEVIEQRVRSDAADVRTVLRRAVGQSVTLLRLNELPITGTLLSVDDVTLLETPSGVLVNPQGTFSLPRTTAIVPSSALEWLVDAPSGGATTLEARYATSGLSWNANYRASLNASGVRFTLRGWMTLVNGSGADFDNAQIALQLAPDNATLIRLPRALDLPRASSRQVPYVSLTDVPAARELVFNPFETQPNFDFAASYTGAPQQTLRLQNTRAAGLGVPLPAGNLTVLGTLPDGTLQTLATRALPFTPPDTPLDIALGAAQGLEGTRTQTSRKLNPRTLERTVEIAFTNELSEAVTVSVVESPPIGSKVTESEPAATSLPTGALQFKVNVPAKGTASLRYVLEVKS